MNTNIIYPNDFVQWQIQCVCDLNNNGVHSKTCLIEFDKMTTHVGCVNFCLVCSIVCDCNCIVNDQCTGEFVQIHEPETNDIIGKVHSSCLSKWKETGKDYFELRKQIRSCNSCEFGVLCEIHEKLYEIYQSNVKVVLK